MEAIKQNWFSFAEQFFSAEEEEALADIELFRKILQDHPELLANCHNHTRASDGRMGLAELVLLNWLCGFKKVVVTDHNAFGYDERKREHRQVAERFRLWLGMEIESGVELSCWFDFSPWGGPARKEVHITGLGVDCSSRELNATLQLIQDGRRERAKISVGLIREAGYGIIDYAELAERYENITLLNIAEHVTETVDGVAVPVDPGRFLEEHLLAGQDCYAPKVLITVEEAIRLIIGAGGTPVWAHPLTTLGFDLFEKHFEEIARAFRELGLAGIEAFTKRQSKIGSERIIAFCTAYGLKFFGGADTHKKGDLLIYVRNLLDLVLGTEKNLQMRLVLERQD